MDVVFKNLEKRIPRLYETECVQLEDKIAAVKLQEAGTTKCWFVVEGEKLGNDFIFWGMIFDNHSRSYDFFTLNDLASESLSLKARIEEDIDFVPTKLSMIQ